jgi:hypothetical protein
MEKSSKLIQNTIQDSILLDNNKTDLMVIETNINSESHDSSFTSFVEKIKNSNLKLRAPWSKERERYFLDTANKNRIILKEIHQLDFIVNIF